MARKPIFKKDGTPTPFFWSDKEQADKHTKTVYKLSGDRVTRMKGVHYDVERNEFRTE